ncbi:MAG TPA: BrnT family toxin [Casimicrobiaceae bacterium]
MSIHFLHGYCGTPPKLRRTWQCTASVSRKRRRCSCDERAITRDDEDSVGEQRFVTLGLSGAGNLLVVVYSWRGAAVIRLISAWRANARQRRQYAQSAS